MPLLALVLHLKFLSVFFPLKVHFSEGLVQRKLTRKATCEKVHSFLPLLCHVFNWILVISTQIQYFHLIVSSLALLDCMVLKTNDPKYLVSKYLSQFFSLLSFTWCHPMFELKVWKLFLVLTFFFFSFIQQGYVTSFT